MFEFLFGWAVGVSCGFVLLGIMNAGKEADADMERLEQILRREP